MENRFDNSASWVILSPIEQSIKRKIEAVGTPLKDWNVKIYRGVLTGYNDAFIIDRAKKDELIAADPKSAEIIRPILRGRDIKRYGYDFADLWLINTHNGIKEQGIPSIDVNEYPAIKAHLDQYYDIISKRYDKGDTPYNLRNCIYTDDFSHQKIIWGEISDKPKFTIDDGIYFLSNKAFLMSGSKLKYLLSFLNSEICEYYFGKIATTTGEGTVQWLKYKVETLPIPIVDYEIEKRLSILIDDIIKSEGERFEQINTQIDNVIYNIYGLSQEEVEYVKNNLKSYKQAISLSVSP